MKIPIYLDYASTTPVDPKVSQKMIKYLTINGIFGNPNSRSHSYGWEAENAIIKARKQIASLIGADSEEIIFTSGATESNNIAIKNTSYLLKKRYKHIITSLTEHKSVLNICAKLEKKGFKITRIIPDINNGLINLKKILESIRSDTFLISLMHANNEIGTINDIKNIGKLCKNNNIIFHVDASQSVGKIPINLKKMNIDLMSFSSHKLYGPKGIGGLFIKKKSKIFLKKNIYQKNNNNNVQFGTLPVHQIVGMGEAYKIAKKEMFYEIPKLYYFKKKLWKGLKKISGIKINGDFKKSIPNILNISFNYIDNISLIMILKNLAISTGSACSSGNKESSYVLKSIGINDNLAKNTLRLSIGRFTTKKEINYSIKYIKDSIKKYNFFFKTL
ncbi:aminotransferase class V-fold PLP-dependent enzyme [Sodalis-like secondary symbiont of Drepanosiphum platanoidis]|uniref:aminotransferase class V-fold PLP-dependent enzyme n=1 Tax=Sodalis-like secondary symbiont of Drepanosiphum platanoidis TaxID=2994493 RepID=UPI0034642E9F